MSSRHLKWKGIAVPVSDEAIDRYREVPAAQRLGWIEEMIRLEAALPKRIQRLHQRFRREAREKYAPLRPTRKIHARHGTPTAGQSSAS